MADGSWLMVKNGTGHGVLKNGCFIFWDVPEVLVPVFLPAMSHEL
jgi:hypothetical protein